MNIRKEMILQEGQALLNRYHLIRLLGEGGYGKVWLAEERILGQKVATVAVKELGDRMDLTEMKILAGLDNPNILQYKATLEEGGRLFMVTEYADGGSSLELLADRPDGLPERQVRAIIRRIARALAHLHSKGLVHRDVKPENILFVRGIAKLCDMGTVMRIGRAGGMHTGTQTTEYAAPEMFRDNVSRASDMYSLAITAFYLLTGRYPFSVKTKMAIENWHRKKIPQIPEELPERWRRFFETCLDKNPRNRMSAEEVVALLEESPPAQNPTRKKSAAVKRTTTRRKKTIVTKEKIISATRKVVDSSGAEGIEADLAVKRIAKEMKIGKLAWNVKLAIEEGLRTSARRGICRREDGVYYPCCRTIHDYTEEGLIRALRGAMGRAWWRQDEAVFFTTRYLGFSRTGPAIREALNSAVRKAVRQKFVERDPKDTVFIRWKR